MHNFEWVLTALRRDCNVVRMGSLLLGNIIRKYLFHVSILYPLKPHSFCYFLTNTESIMCYMRMCTLIIYPNGWYSSELSLLFLFSISLMVFYVIFAFLLPVLVADSLCSPIVYDVYLEGYPTKCGNKCERYKEYDSFEVVTM